METMILVGAEDVRAGGAAASHAGAEMKLAAATIDYALEQHRRWMDEWLGRFELILEVDRSERLEKAKETK